MNYCATHNQFYSSHCVYCGPPAVRPGVVPYTIPTTLPLCSACGNVLMPGVPHICMTAGQTGTAPGSHVCIAGTGRCCVVCGKAMFETSGFITTLERPESSGSSTATPPGHNAEAFS